METPEELVTAALEALSTAEGELIDAKEHACNARSEAENAADSANEARNSADSCDDDCLLLEQSLAELRTQLEALCETVQSPTDSLDHQIARHKRDVLRHLELGHSSPSIAKHLDISEVLIDMIVRQSERQAA
jgi:hypothetical protein